MKIPSLSRIAHFHTCRTKLEMKLKWLKKKSRKRLVYSHIPPPMERCRIKNRMITLEWMWKRLLDVKCPGLSQHLVFPRIEKCGIISKCRSRDFMAITGHFCAGKCPVSSSTPSYNDRSVAVQCGCFFTNDPPLFDVGTGFVCSLQLTRASNCFMALTLLLHN